MKIIKHIKDKIKGKIPSGHKRSSKWPKTRKEHLVKNPACAACGSLEKIEVHHIKPFHLHPELELEPSNLITLCESKSKGVDCHRFFGHLGNYKHMNESVAEDVKKWLSKLLDQQPRG